MYNNLIMRPLRFKRIQKVISFASYLLLVSMGLSACSVQTGGFEAYSLLKDPNFKEKITYSPKKNIDVLLMVDNSALMDPVHAKLQNNAGAFLQEFVNRSLDFQIAVGLTDAYRRKYDGNAFQTKFSEGEGESEEAIPSGYPIVDPQTPNAASILAKNLRVGLDGSPDVRGLESIEDVLEEPLNTGFIRNFSHLATVFITTEDDFSNNTPYVALSMDYEERCIYECNANSTDLYYMDPVSGNYIPNISYYGHTPQNPDPATGRYLIPVSTYKNYVKGKVGSSEHLRPYSFHAYSVIDHNCRMTLDNQDGVGPEATFIPKRYLDLMAISGGGTSVSVCANGAQAIKRLATEIISENYKFKLPAYANQTQIEVSIGGSVVAEDPTHGWSFDPSTLILSLHGDAIPGSQTPVDVRFIIN